MAKPVAAKDILKRLETIIAHHRQFIEYDAYFGPDLRRRDQGPPNGTKERRDSASSAPDASNDALSPEQALAS